MIDPGPGADMPAFRNSRPGGVIQRRGKRGTFFGDDRRYLFEVRIFYGALRGVCVPCGISQHPLAHGF